MLFLAYVERLYRSFGMLDNNLLGPLSLIRAYKNPGKELMLHLILHAMLLTN